MIYKVVFSSLSLIDLENIIAYYYKLNINTAKKYYNEIYETVKKLEDFPKIGRIVPEFEDEFYDKYRELIYENFRIIYKITDDYEVVIIRIIDGRRLLEINMVER